MEGNFYPFLRTDHSLHRDFKVITKLKSAEELEGNSKLVSNFASLWIDEEVLFQNVFIIRYKERKKFIKRSSTGKEKKGGESSQQMQQTSN